jgi:hypothetical protein
LFGFPEFSKSAAKWPGAGRHGAIEPSLRAIHDGSGRTRAEKRILKAERRRPNGADSSEFATDGFVT